MRQLALNEIDSVGGGNLAAWTLGIGSAICAVGAGVLVAAASPELLAGAAVYGATSAVLALGAAVLAD